MAAKDSIMTDPAIKPLRSLAWLKSFSLLFAYSWKQQQLFWEIPKLARCGSSRPTSTEDGPRER
jgi:hypothetical protein